MVNISMARSAIESLYFDTATIIEYREVFNTEDGSSNVEEVIAHENVPCKLSYYMTTPTDDAIGGDVITQRSKIFIANEIEIKPGSKVVVTQNGITTMYKNSGQPSRYRNHQEIKLELWEDRS